MHTRIDPNRFCIISKGMNLHGFSIRHRNAQQIGEVIFALGGQLYALESIPQPGLLKQ